MFESFGIIDFIDIALASALLLYLYLTMKKSGAINVFLGIVFLLVVFTVLRISRMTLMKGIFDTIISQGVIILIILSRTRYATSLVMWAQTAVCVSSSGLCTNHRQPISASG